MIVKFSNQAPIVVLLSAFFVFAAITFGASAARVQAASETDSESTPDSNLQVPNEKVQELMQRGKYLERQILVRQKNANERNDASAHQYSIGYKDGYNKAVLDLLKSQLLNGVDLPSGRTPAAPAAKVVVPVLPANPIMSRQPASVPSNTAQIPMSNQVTPAAPPQAARAPTSVSAGANIPVPAIVAPSPTTRPSTPAPAPTSAPAKSTTIQPSKVAAPGVPALVPPSASVSNSTFPGKEIPLLEAAPAAPKNVASSVPPMKPDSFKQLMQKSTRALENKQWKQAAEYASSAIAIKNDVAASYINRSWALGELGDTRQALVDANLAIQLQPKMGLAYNNRAYTYELMNDLPNARNDYQRACSFGFNSACAVVPKVDQVLAKQQSQKRTRIQALTGQSEDLIKSRDWPQLIQVASDILKLNPNHAGAYINRAWARAETGKLEQSLADAGKAIIINPSDPVAYNNRAYTYELMNDLRSARRDYAKACELKLKSACEVVAKIDQIQKRQASPSRKTSKAVPVTKAKRAGASSKKEQITQLISSSFEKFREGNWTAVEQLSNQVLKIDPRNALAYVNRAGARTEMGLLYNALDDIEKAIRLNPKLGIAYNNKGYALEKMGDRKKAALQYQKACNLGLQQSCKEFRRLTGRRK